MPSQTRPTSSCCTQTLTGTLLCTWVVSVVIGQGQPQVPAETRRVKVQGSVWGSYKRRKVCFVKLDTCRLSDLQEYVGLTKALCPSTDPLVHVVDLSVVLTIVPPWAAGAWPSLMVFRTVLDSSFFWGLLVATWGSWGAGLAVSVQPSVFTKVQ